MYFLDPRLYAQFNSSEIIYHNINLKHTTSSKKYLLCHVGDALLFETRNGYGKVCAVYPMPFIFI
jgi:hypothetical protein